MWRGCHSAADHVPLFLDVNWTPLYYSRPYAQSDFRKIPLAPYVPERNFLNLEAYVPRYVDRPDCMVLLHTPKL